jgi:hypothetical protein
MANTPTNQDQPKATLSKVTLSSPGISVAVESHQPLDQVATRAEQLHQALADRYGSPPLPTTGGGYQ